MNLPRLELVWEPGMPESAIEQGQTYLLHVAGEWFTGALYEYRGLSHTCGGMNTMWESHTLGSLIDGHQLHGVYRIAA